MTYTKSHSRTVSAIAVIDLANELITRKCLGESVLANLGDDFNACYSAWRDGIAIQEKRLPERLLIELWKHAEESVGDSTLGLDIGKVVNHHAKGILANWIIQSETLSESFDIFSQNIHLLNPSEEWTKIEEGDSVRLLFRFKESYPSIAVDRSMATIISWSSNLSGHTIFPIQASFTRPTPHELDEYRATFGDNLAFNHQENSLTFSKDIFNHRTKTNNPYLKELLEDKAAELSLTLNSKQSLKATVERLLYLDLTKYCNIGASCEALHLSRSSLYRKLKAEGTNFSVLVKFARIRKTKQLELNNHAADKVAEELGFQDVGSYYRFRKTIDPIDQNR